MKGKTNISLPPSNKNLLINWYFSNPINQRGLTEYSGAAKYTIDMWKSSSARGIITLESGTLKITSTEDSTNYAYLYQAIENGFLYYNIPLTFSVLDADNELHLLTTILKAEGQNKTLKTSFGCIRIGSDNAWGYLYTAIGIEKGGNSKSFIASKLEIGTKQTLAHLENGKWILNDPHPNKTEELLKCQRHYWQTVSDYQSYNYGMAINETEALIYINFPVRMRTYPTVVKVNLEGLYLNDPSKATTYQVLDISNYCGGFDGMTLRVKVEGGLTPGNMYRLETITGGKIGFSAEL